MRRDSLLLAAALAGVVSLNANAAQQDGYEVWAIDQSNSPGLAFGGTVYIWNGHDLERGHDAANASTETIDLGGAAAALCLAETGANPVRPHTIAFNTSQTHAIISFVARPRLPVGRGHQNRSDREHIPLEGEVSDDPTPDLLALSPNGSHAFVSLRGPFPLTADSHVSTGSTPGVGLIKVLESGRGGLFEARVSVSNIDAGGVERADVHAMAIRIK